MESVFDALEEGVAVRSASSRRRVTSVDLLKVRDVRRRLTLLTSVCWELAPAEERNRLSAGMRLPELGCTSERHRTVYVCRSELPEHCRQQDL